jgi:hypothetical protein
MTDQIDPESPCRIEVSHKGNPLGEHEVGYGRPPVSTQFKAGTCANPKGRPKGAKNTATLVRDKLDEKVPVRQNGKMRKMTKRELGIAKAINRFAESGDLSALEKLHKLESGGSHAVASGGEPPPAQDPQQDRARRKKMLRWFLDSNRGAEPGTDDEEAAA